jgi:hypothetical protein
MTFFEFATIYSLLHRMCQFNLPITPLQCWSGLLASAFSLSVPRFTS